MAMVAAEAAGAEGAGAAGAAEAGSSAGAGGSRSYYRRSTSTPQKQGQGAGDAGPWAQQSNAQDNGQGGGRSRSLASRLPDKTYHRIILAEFLACVILIGAAPVLGTAGSKNTSKPQTPSYAGVMARLTAVCVVFFVLALMGAGQKTGKVAAAFGALVLLGTALNATDEFAALAQLFGKNTIDQQVADAAVAGAQAVDSGQPAPKTPAPKKTVPTEPEESEHQEGDIPI
jgi:hypothetical protein